MLNNSYLNIHMNEKNVLSQLKQRLFRTRVLSGLGLPLVLLITFFIDTNSETKLYMLLSLGLLAAVVSIVDYALFPIPNCPKCKKALSFALRLTKEERKQVLYCPYCSTSLNVEV